MNAVKTSLIKIGNSRGIRLPRLLIDQVGLGNEVEITVEHDQLVIRPYHAHATTGMSGFVLWQNRATIVYLMNQSLLGGIRASGHGSQTPRYDSPNPQRDAGDLLPPNNQEHQMIDFTSKFGRKAKRHLAKDYVVWLTTVGSDLSPQPRPVWFIWEGSSFLIFSQPHAHKVRHLTAHPKVALHFNTDETGDRDVIVFIGAAAIDTSVPPAHEVPAYFKKYRTGIAGLGMTPEQFSREYSVAIRVTPTTLRGW